MNLEDAWHAHWSHESYERMLRGDDTPVDRAEFDRMIAQVRAEELQAAANELTEQGVEPWDRDTPAIRALLFRKDRIEKEAGL